jgi:hypothetical protein
MDAMENNQSQYRPSIPLFLSITGMASSTSSSDILILAVGVVLAALYLFRDQLFAASKPKTVPGTGSKISNGSGNPRDFIAKMKEGVSSAVPSSL